MVSKTSLRVYSDDMKRFILNFRTIYQFGFSLLIIAALLTQFIYGGLQGGFTFPYIALFISYFTILSNILVAFVLCVEAKASLRGTELSARMEWLRGFAVFCMVATGITYTFFLRGPAGAIHIENALPWANEIFHHVMPIVVFLDWLLFPPKRNVRWFSILYWIILTAFYALFVEALGFFSHAYPYFFLNPNFRGYTGVLFGSAGFIPFFLVFGLVIVLANKIRMMFRK